MVSGLGTIDVIILEVSHFDKAILDRGWMVALDLCRKEKKKNDSNIPSITLGPPPGAQWAISTKNVKKPQIDVITIDKGL